MNQAGGILRFRVHRVWALPAGETNSPSVNLQGGLQEPCKVQETTSHIRNKTQGAGFLKPPRKNKVTNSEDMSINALNA